MLILQIAAGVALAPLLLIGALIFARWIVTDARDWWDDNRDWITGAVIVVPPALVAALNSSY